MTDTPNIALPLLAAAQAQKHVTVNDALLRLDALTQIVVLSGAVTDPPVDAEAGDRYAVPSGATGAWSDKVGDLAFFVEGGWAFASPKEGWRIWVEDERRERRFLDGAWREIAVGASASGAALAARVIESDEPVQPGSGFDATLVIPDRAVVLGVTGRVVDALTGGGATSWRLGVAGSTDRYGSGVGVGLNASVTGISGAPVGYYGATPLRIEAEGGDFATGTIRLALHYFEISAPAPV
ncbi:MAG: DUF2793 domain-containing protein [Pseudomonadota bacterium]